MLALASLAFVGCSKDEVIDVQQDAIRFTANAAKATRGTATTTTSLNAEGQAFSVWAYNATNDAEFMAGTTFSYSAASENGSAYWIADPIKFWPNGYDLDFYAVHPIPSNDNGIKMNMTTEEKEITDFSANSDFTKQIDLIFATEFGAKKQSTAQAINFRHALSQIVFAAKVSHAELSVDIKSVTVNNVINKGTYTFPSSSTSTQLKGDTGAQTEESTVDGIMGTYGTWDLSEEDADVVNFVAGISETPGIENNDGQVPLTSDNGALFLLPQSFVGADYSYNTVGGGASNVKPGDEGEIYFILECKIRQDGSYLFGSDAEYGEVAIPASSAYDDASALAGDKWEQGKKYTYIFNFNSGGGYDPETGDPILVPIKLTVTVDDFQSANKEVNM